MMKPHNPGLLWHMRRRGWIILDTILAAAAILMAYALQSGFVFGWGTSNPAQPGAFQGALIYPWFVLLSMHVAGLHDPLGDRRRWFALLRIILAVVSALGLCLFALYVTSLHQIGRTILVRTLILSVVFLAGARMILWQLASTAAKRVGCLLAPERLTRFRALVVRHLIPFEIIVPEPEGSARAPEDIAEFFIREGVDEILVASSEGRRDVWLACFNRGIPVSDVAVFVEREYYKVSCDDIDVAWFLGIDLKWNHPFYHRLKRMIDFFVAGASLVLLSPIILTAALAVLIESGRPIFYSQMRVGFRGKSYRLWKLRTMRTDAETGGARWAEQNDLRVTRVGRILRATRVDELPQLLNVLKGEMSLIGPRPERPEFIEWLTAEIPLFPQRHWIKPGITGWAQINYPYGASVADSREKLCYDLYYLKNTSLLLDLHIALRTIGSVMKGSR
jgi:exopolysaccharide biosynthesis polyprenyl glycosylphosphotransferase